jgi:hypothetical protein
MSVFREPDVLLLDIPEFENYQVSELGQVYSKITGKELKPRISSRGYEMITFRKKGSDKQYSFLTHRLVALAFVPNVNNKPYVDHIDMNKLNNNYKNLRWVTNSENQMNTGMWSSNTSGYKGISHKIKENKYHYWEASIKKNNKSHSKNFPYTEDGFLEAMNWRRQKELELHQIF